MLNIIYILIGGGLGAVARAAITDYWNTHHHSSLPIATLIVNLIGSIMISILLGLSIHNPILSNLIITGFLGGLTTFSTLSKELVEMLTTKFNISHFITYSLLQFVVGFIACYIGYHI
ncbi:fluoride efflux transporter FluC [Staphylococcus simiae]|uniref:Fluoride-specific ion channel FluC n=1 Tax=Staphylococcus simiae CCM 7213 = CCUG 51256 TaxID=911238 RepID=G5JJC0_9STAP|nr:CrcB family protein [Staphylococcus simiae]EHJ07689.1 crcB family protein [Staphylococcus simiae CCM 7213 = CCUG 51256]PNZ13572.1 CrcB family protein [Staphylococcus simiae]SNV75158.1 CrcB-like protein [Staphylococcus simiae]